MSYGRRPDRLETVLISWYILPKARVKLLIFKITIDNQFGRCHKVITNIVKLGDGPGQSSHKLKNGAVDTCPAG